MSTELFQQNTKMDPRLFERVNEAFSHQFSAIIGAAVMIGYGGPVLKVLGIFAEVWLARSIIQRVKYPTQTSN